MHRAIVLLVLTVPAGACAAAQAKAVVEPVSLEVPAAPPRVVEPVAIDPPPPPPVEEPPHAPAAPVNTKPRAQQPRDRSGDARPEPKSDPDPDPVVPVAPPVPPLRTGPPSANADETRRQISDTILRARQLLDPMDTTRLSGDRMANYQSAKDSILRAEAALKLPNLVLAKQLAEKAENIARQLSNR